MNLPPLIGFYRSEGRDTLCLNLTLQCVVQGDEERKYAERNELLTLMEGYYRAEFETAMQHLPEAFEKYYRPKE